jgi:hypothetical protein
VVVTVEIRRIERRRGRLSRIAGKVQYDFGLCGCSRRAFAGDELDVVQRTRVETSVGSRRINLQSLILAVDHISVPIDLESASTCVRQRTTVVENEEALAAER